MQDLESPGWNSIAPRHIWANQEPRYKSLPPLPVWPGHILSNHRRSAQEANVLLLYSPITKVHPTNPPYFWNFAEGQKKIAPGEFITFGYVVDSRYSYLDCKGKDLGGCRPVVGKEKISSSQQSSKLLLIITLYPNRSIYFWRTLNRLICTSEGTTYEHACQRCKE